MIKRFKQFNAMLLAVMVLLTVGGCWDSRELNDIGIVMGVGLDQADTPDEIEMTLQIAKISGSKSSSTQSKESKTKEGGEFFFNVKNTGPDVPSILQKFTRTLSRKPELSQTEIIVFGEDLAEKGVRDSFDFFARSSEVRMTVYVLVAKGKAGDMLDVQPGFEKFPASEIYTLVEDPVGSVDKTPVLSFDLEQWLLSKSASSVAPMIEMVEENGEKRIQTSGCAVFKGDKVIGMFNLKESRGLQWVKGKVKYSALSVESDGELTEIVIASSKSKIKPVIESNGSVLIRLEISVEGFISSQTGSVNVAAPDNAERLTENTENTIKREIETTIRKAQALGADIFGFDSCFYRSYPREWKTLEPKWGEVFRNIRVETDVTVTIKGSGNLAKPLYPE